VENSRLLGKQIKKRRKKKGITQAELAEKVGVTTVYMTYLETGKYFPSIKRLIKIAKVLGVRVGDFFTF